MQNLAAIQNCRWQITSLENSQQDARARIDVLRRRTDDLEDALRRIASHRAKLEFAAEKTRGAAAKIAAESRLRAAADFGEAFSGRPGTLAAYNESDGVCAGLKAKAEEKIRACEEETSQLRRRIEEDGQRIHSLRQQISYLSAVG